MSKAIAQGTSTSHGDTLVLRFALYLPHGVEKVWGAVATPVGLPGWLAAVDVFESRLGGRIALRRPGDPAASGIVTAWDVGHVAEYTVSVHGRIRFHLESVGPEASVVRFTNERAVARELRPDLLACWHQRFEFLHDALDGNPRDWSVPGRERRRELRELYESVCVRQS
ncbi:hypothetical protein [Streptomyces sp. NBC_00344]|uniref:hypothetical protein n=1 Tax=Streptomyces sp. NBC_00344 TaxID=2975720 RepID=UPI002E1A4244